MRNRLMIATVALLLLVPANAFADEAVGDDVCYSDPDDDSCTEIESRVEEQPDGDVGSEVEGQVEEASVEVITTSAETDDAALAETGVSATLFSVIAALMLAAGALLLVVARRRGSAV